MGGTVLKKLELNIPAFTAYRRSPEVQAMLAGYARQVAARCGEGYESDVKLMPTRAIAGVRTTTEKAARENARDQTLIRALASMKGRR